ncbi:MAG: hypothetical protein V4676_01805, partial [Bacteroidota bacterium]
MSPSQLQQLIETQRSGYSLEQPFYTSQSVLDFEWKHIWQKNWLFTGSTAQIPKPGDYFLYQLQQDALIIIR